MRALITTILGLFLGVLNIDRDCADKVDDLQEYPTSAPTISNELCGSEPGFDWSKVQFNPIQYPL